MKVSGVMTVRDVFSCGYPYLEAILSVLPIVDEFLVADGGSKDDTLKYLERLKERFPEKVRLFVFPWHKSRLWQCVDDSVNLLIEKAKGDWLFFVGADNIWHEEDIPKLKRHLEYAHTHGYNSIRHQCLDMTWGHLHSYIYRNVRMVRKVPGLKSYWGMDDFHIGDNASPRKGYTSHNVPPELEIDIPFYHFHRPFPENGFKADQNIAEFMATEDSERQEAWQRLGQVDRRGAVPLPPEKVHPKVPAIMRGLSQDLKYRVREELFDLNYSSLKTSTNIKLVKGGQKMELIPNFEIDSFLRKVWITKEARGKWDSVFREISQFVQELETISVLEGQRKCAWQTIEESSLIDFSKKWGKQGLVVVPMMRVGMFEGFAHKHAPVIPGKPCNVCVVVARNQQDASEFVEAVEAADDVKQGTFLGYPLCCGEFFKRVWSPGYYDPVWQAAMDEQTHVVEKSSDRNKMRVRGHPYSNPILRYVGLRLSFHIPCSFNCEESIKVSENRISLAKKYNPRLTGFLLQLLNMPHSWDCYHGIAVVRTPICYIITSSVPSIEQYIIEVEGDFIPSGAEKGIGFPFDLTKESTECEEVEGNLFVSENIPLQNEGKDGDVCLLRNLDGSN